MADHALVGIDIGTTATKAVLLDGAGRRLAEHAAAHATARPAPGRAEQDPEDWMAAVTAALARFAASEGPPVAAIGITGQVNTHVFCDGGGTVLHPAITWADTRAAAQGAALDARLTEAEKIAALGAPIPLDASHALARMAWMAETHPEVWDATAAVLLPKDLAIARLTGAAGGDPIAAIGLAGPDFAYAGAVVGLMPGAAARLPPLADPLEVAGAVGEGAFAGVPVVRGTMDAWASMFGVGVAEEGAAMHLCGTSDVLGLISATRTGAPGVVAFPTWRGIALHAGPTQSGGAALAWAARLLGTDPAGAAALAAGGAVAADSPLFLPHLEGERAPLWDAESRGTFAGLAARHGPADLARSVMEGTAFAARMALEAVEASGGRRAETLLGGGGGAASDAWCQIRADVLGRPWQRQHAPDAGAVGAAVMAGAGVGLVPDLAAAARTLVRADRRFDPDPHAAALADRRYGLFRDLYAAARPVNAALGAG
ncbi:carbohydrate kinase [Rhodobacteraceae bacterium CCMM004]|nr:carbohydrate kinase [Rhodobacteraceae bacterium CCMM004]